MEKWIKQDENNFIVDLSPSNIKPGKADNSIYISERNLELFSKSHIADEMFQNNEQLKFDRATYELNYNNGGQHQLKIISEGRFANNFNVKYYKEVNGIPLTHRYMKFDFDEMSNYIVPVENIYQYLMCENELEYIEQEYLSAINQIYEKPLDSYLNKYPKYLDEIQKKFGKLNFKTISKIEKSDEYKDINNTSNNIWSAALAQYIATLQYKFRLSQINSEKTEIQGSIMKNNLNRIVKSAYVHNKKSQIIIDGAPGTGKSFNVNKEVEDNNIKYERVTFYQDYEYHNFVGSILPVVVDGDISYEFVNGPFTKILKSALSNPEETHYLIIEELTRGNAASIFGDVFQLLDRDKDGFSEYPITNDNIYNSLSDEVQAFLTVHFESKIVLPPNLSIICTINSSDQNVFPLDTAFKRRFDYEIKSTSPSDDFIDFNIQIGDIHIESWKEFYTKLNSFILRDLKLKEDKQVGPYFIKNHEQDEDKLKSIQTKLAMYLWNDLHKVHTISNKAIFDNNKVHTLYDVDRIFREGSKQEITNILTAEFIAHFGIENE